MNAIWLVNELLLRMMDSLHLLRFMREEEIRVEGMGFHSLNHDSPDCWIALIRKEDSVCEHFWASAPGLGENNPGRIE